MEKREVKLPLKRNFRQKLRYYWLRLKDEQYKYRVLYADGTVSREKCEQIGRIPLGVIFENHLITLKDSPQKMTWQEAQAYCQSIKIMNRSCEAGTRSFWEEYMHIRDNMAVSEILVSLGGEAIKPEEKSWASSEASFDGELAWVWYYACYGLELNVKDKHLYNVRPIIELAKTSL